MKLDLETESPTEAEGVYLNFKTWEHILTNDMRVRRKITPDAYCQRCDYRREDIAMLIFFWDYPRAKKVWSLFLPEDEVAQSINISFLEWTEYNLRWRDREYHNRIISHGAICFPRFCRTSGRIGTKNV